MVRLFSSSLLLLPALLRSALAANGTACNNSPLLCDRAYNDVTYLGAHDSPFISDSSNNYNSAGNQYFNVTIQLDAGVRLVTGQVHNTNSSYPADGEWNLCHTSCDLYNAGLLSTWLSEIRAWLALNPNDVVTIVLVNSENATQTELAGPYQAADIEQYAYTPDFTSPPTKWPTLQTLINNGTRLINFVANRDSPTDTKFPYLMDEFTFCFENQFDNTAVSNFSCEANRPASVDGNTYEALQQKLMPLLNHFLDLEELFDIETPNTAYLNVTNAPSGGEGNLGDFAAGCASAYGKAPNFLLVDYFNVGPAIATVDKLNGVTDPVGRMNVTTLRTLTTSGAGRTSLSFATLFAALIVALLAGIF